MRSRPVVLIAAFLAVLTGGIWLGGHPEHLPGPIRDTLVKDDRALRAEVTSSIEDNFYKKVDRKKLEAGSLNGMVESLGDQFSHYLTPEQAARFQEDVHGEFEGVGMNVEEAKRGLRVLRVFGSSPAQRAGIMKDDLIVAVNGRSISGLSSDVAVARIKGPSGTSVRLGVVSGDHDPRTLKVRRERIDIPVAAGRIVTHNGKKVGVVRLTGFSSGAHGFLRRQVDKVLKKGAQGIVLDLRGNGGGLLTEGVLVASIFIEHGKIVSVRGRSRSERTEDAAGGAISPKIPVVVLVDSGSASASEIVTGALRDRKRATVVGTTTYGKGLVQEMMELSNGGLLDLTVANYYLPNGETITTKGIKPAVKARDNPRTARDEALPAALDAVLAKQR